MSHALSELAAKIGAEQVGDADPAITGLEMPDRACEGQLTLIFDQANAANFESSKASAALVAKGINLDNQSGKPLLVVEDTTTALITLLNLFAPPAAKARPGVDDSARIDPSAKIGSNVSIGPYCCIGANVELGDNCILHERVSIQHDTTIGNDCVLYPGVVVRERCIIGQHTVLHSNVVVGTDGFGYRPAPDGKGEGNTGLVKVPQIGRVVIGNYVEIGAGTCLDRGTFSDTIVGDGCKIDNLVQVAHNCRLGRSVIIAGQSGVAGSTHIGDGVMIGAQVGLKDHIDIGAGAKLAARSGVMDNVPAGETWGGEPAMELKKAIHEHLTMKKMMTQFDKQRKARNTGKDAQKA